MSSIPTILVIEDNLADTTLLRLCLDDLEEVYNLEVVADGEQALRYIQEYRSGYRQPHPCVIVLDLHLPKYNGVEVLSAIKKTPALSHIEVMVLTTSASPAQRLTIERLGATCRTKPSSFPQFRELTMEIVAICKGLARAA